MEALDACSWFKSLRSFVGKRPLACESLHRKDHRARVTRKTRVMSKGVDGVWGGGGGEKKRGGGGGEGGGGGGGGEGGVPWHSKPIGGCVSQRRLSWGKAEVGRGRELSVK